MKSDGQEEKQALRRALLEKRRALPTALRNEWSRRIAAGLREIDAYRAARRVMCYAAVRGEAETAGLVRECLARGAQVALPRLDATTGRIEARWIRDPGADLAPGAFGIPEPREDRCAPVAPKEIDLFIVPGVGFDPRGNRLGWGRGLYDALLAGASPRSVKVGLAYEAQVVRCIPAGSRDVEVDVLVTEERTINCAGIRTTLDKVKQVPPGLR